MLYRVILLIFAVVWATPMFAGEEMNISQFLDLIEERLLTDEQIRAFTKGAKIEAPLRRAREQKREYVIQKLLEACDHNGDTPLLCAVQSNNQKLAQDLLDAGANPNNRNCRKLVGVMLQLQGYTFHSRYPLAVAALETKSPKMVELLLDKGAFDPDYNSGDVADHLATTVFKAKLYGRNSAQEKTDLKEIESMLLLAARQRLLADTLRCNTKPQDQEPQDKEQCAQQDGGPEEKSGDALVPDPKESSVVPEKSWWQSNCILS
jgi:hypothetical protein